MNKHHDTLYREAMDAENAFTAACQVAYGRDAGTIDLQARFVIDDDTSDTLAGPRRIAPRYTYIANVCAGKRCNHS